MGNKMVTINWEQIQDKNASHNSQSTNIDQYHPHEPWNKQPNQRHSSKRDFISQESEDRFLSQIGFSWIPTNTRQCGELEDKAVVAGYESIDDSLIYVGRAWHEGNLLPCKVNLRHRMAFIAYEMKELNVENFEMYCQSSTILQWIAPLNGNIPSGAVAAGHTESGEPLYVGRAHYSGSLMPGMVHPSHGCCYVSYAGKKVNITNYEVMTVSYSKSLTPSMPCLKS